MSTVTSTSNSASTSIQDAAQSIISGSTKSNTDVNAIITALVNAKVAGKTAALTDRATRDNNQLTAIGMLNSVLSLLQSALTPLANGSAFNMFTASASGKGLTASAGQGVVAGSYEVDVKNIAASQSITSGAFTSKTALGAGSLTLSVGGKSTTINIESGKSTLADIAAAINSASGNPGVSATVVNGVDGAHLMLHSTSTGLANGINIQVKSDSADLNKLSVKTSVSTTIPATTEVDDSGNWKQSVAGQDAHLSISGMEIESASNTVTSAIDGLTLNLSADAVDNPQTLTIAQDVTDQKTAISAFVTAYNNFVTSAASFAGFDATKKAGSQGGVLLGDTTLNAIRNTLSGAISGGGLKQGSGMANLAAIGITLQKDGTLKTDDVKLTTALTTDPMGVAKLFNSKTGLAASMNTSLTSFLKTGGTLNAHSNALTADLKSISAQQAQLTAYTDKLTKGYNAQFTALNNLMTQMSQNGDYLTALFGGQNSAGALANNK
ncbi:flagellar hook-associated protein 2 [Paraburkholderia sp. EB58]|jgi:flagellar hook-associated protein 2|uniref:flagellar filament capping protein FliD n=1 Tax=Paraburkholderia sp. EB58 TaxID=3035125 RepID=UPI003D24D52F